MKQNFDLREREAGSSFDPTTWIDRQRQGDGGNVFDNIMAASASIRQERLRGRDPVLERVARVQRIRAASAQHDAIVSPRSENAQNFADMVSRWKKGGA